MSIVVASSVFLFIGLLGITAVVYNIVYKSRINRALHGEERIKTVEPQMILIGISIVTLLIFGIVNISKTTNLENQFFQLQTKYNSLRSDIWALNSNISSLEGDINRLVESALLVSDVESSFIDIDEDDDTLGVFRVSFTLKELAEDATVSLLIVDSNQTQTTIELTSASLTFTEDITLQLDDVFDISVLISGSTVLQESLFTIEPVDYIEGRFISELSQIVFEEDTISFTIQTINEYNGIDELLIDQVVIEVFYNEVLQTTETLTTASFTNETMEIFDYSVTLNDGDEIGFNAFITITDSLGETYIFTVIF